MPCGAGEFESVRDADLAFDLAGWAASAVEETEVSSIGRAGASFDNVASD
jgi:hypothetical protein